MLSKNNIKQIRSLQNLKFRRQLGLFIAEGPKVVNEVLNSNFVIDSIFATQEWIDKNIDVELPENTQVITGSELHKISKLKTPNEVLAIIKIPESVEIPDPLNCLMLMLDDIKDPGNLGTIIRTADWFGVRHIICSSSSVDVYNPKVVQSAMGSIFRIDVFYSDLVDYLRSIKPNTPVYGTVLDGSNVYSSDLSNHGIILIGSESHGISAKLFPFITKKISIPNYSDSGSAESLNASIATALTLSEFRRKKQ